MDLSGQQVKHKVFGDGVIKQQHENKITVSFAKKEKMFLFPDAVPRYLIFQDASVQKQIEGMNEEQQRKEHERKQQLEEENEYRNRLYKMKILPTSQVAYNITKTGASDFKYVETGHYLGGKMKNLPRIPTNVQPNSAVVLTDCACGREEDRKIVGAAMVDERFWGKECRDGRIRLHEEYQLMLPAEHQLPFWSYFSSSQGQVPWGSIPFKYLHYQTMEKMLLAICRNMAGTEQEEKAVRLYRCFCRLNRLDDKYEEQEMREDTQEEYA